MRRNVRTAVAAMALTAGLAFPVASVATGAPAPASAPASAVVTANEGVGDAIDHLRSGRPITALDVVRADEPLDVLLSDPRFLANVHRLQEHLHTHDAGALAGADVAVADVLALDVDPDGRAVLFTR